MSYRKATPVDVMTANRIHFEQATANALEAAQRNEFIGYPVTSLERKIRRARDQVMKSELAKARRALDKFEKAAWSAGGK